MISDCTAESLAALQWQGISLFWFDMNFFCCYNLKTSFKRFVKGKCCFVSKFVKKASLVFVILIIGMLVILTSCRKPLRTEEDGLVKSNIEPKPAWEALIAGYEKTAAASSYDVVLKTHKDAVYSQYSSVEDLEYTLKIADLNSEDFAATAKKQNAVGKIMSEYFFVNDKFYIKENVNVGETTNKLYISDNINVLKEVTGLDLFSLDTTALKAAVADSKSIKKGNEGGLSSIRFELSAEEMTSIMGDSFEVITGMDKFTGFMYFYMDSNGFLVKFGYDSHFSAVFDGEESYIKKNVEYIFSNINNVDKVETPDWVSSLTPDKTESVKYIKNNVDYIFLYEAISESSEYGYKLYDIINSEDDSAKIKLADVPAEINGLPVFEISGTAISFGKGVETLVLPEHITEVPYPEVSTPMTVFCKCSELSVPAISGTTVYLAGEWGYANGVPTAKR